MNEHTDFFISYTGVDVDWAEWMAGILEQVGYTTVLQARDFRPGSDFVHEMQQATSTAERTIAILSPAYFGSRFGEAEWRAAFFKDPTGELGLLVPVRVQDCEPPGLLATRVYIDLVGLPEKVAAERLRTGVSQGRAKRFDDGLGSAIVAGATAVPFPGGSSNSRRRTRRLAVAAMAIAAVSVMAMIARGVIDEPLGGRSDPPSASKVH